MRLKSAIWVGAYVRRLIVENIPAMVVARGAEEAGAVFVKLNFLDGTAKVFGPAPQTVFDEDRPVDRAWMVCTGAAPVAEADADSFLARQRRFDSDLWIVEVEDRHGRHMLEPVVDLD